MKEGAKKAKSKSGKKPRKTAKKRGPLPGDTRQFLLQLGRRVRELREMEGLSQNQLAYECDISRTTINRIEKGHYDTGVSTIFILANVLNVEVPELLNFKVGKSY